MDVTLRQADAREVEWPEYDVLITDPPYRAEVHARATSQSAKRGTRHRDLGFESLNGSLQEWTCRFAARARRWIVIFSDLESITPWKCGLESAGAKYVRTIPWVRWSMPQLSGDRPPQGAEAIILGHGRAKRRKHWDGPGNLTHFSQKCLRGKNKHRAEKPLDLALALVHHFSDAGETVADPFAGAGTFGLACRILGRGYEGTEKDAEWYRKAGDRLGGSLSARDLDRRDRWEESCGA
jgi:DNA methylase